MDSPPDGGARQEVSPTTEVVSPGGLRQRKRVSAVEPVEARPVYTESRKRFQCNSQNGFWVCGLKCCPRIVVEWIPLCLLLFAFTVLFLAGLMIAFFLTSTSFAILAQENAWEMQNWIYSDRPMVSVQSPPNLVFVEESSAVVIDVSFPMSTYVPSLVGLTVVHYGVSLRYVPLYESSSRSLCVVNGVLGGGSCGSEDQRRLGRLDALDPAHRDSLHEQVEGMLREAKYFLNSTTIDAILPTPLQVYPPAPRLPNRRHLWPMQVNNHYDDESESAEVEVTWKPSFSRTNSRTRLSARTERPVQAAEFQSLDPLPPVVLGLRDIWRKESLSTKMSQQLFAPAKTKLQPDEFLPRWRRNASRDFLALDEFNNTLRLQILDLRDQVKKKHPRDIRIGLHPHATHHDVSWWVTSTILTRLQACKDDAIETSEWLNVLLNYGTIDPKDIKRFGDTCGELWLSVLHRLRNVTEDRVKLETYRALAAVSAEEINYEYILPAETRMVHDPLRDKHLPKGSSGPHEFKFYQEVNISDNASFCTALRRDCESWSFVLFELHFEGVYPCRWCSFLFRPHSYHYPFIIPCDVADVRC